jgi:hypothetical protein
MASTTNQRMAPANPLARKVTATCSSISGGFAMTTAATHAKGSNTADDGGILRGDERIVDAGNGVVRAAGAAETLGSHCDEGVCDLAIWVR